MHGIFNRGLQCFVRDIFGLEIWEQTCRQADLPYFNFEAMLRYEDGVTDRVIDALSAVLKRPRNELLEDFGTYVVSEFHMAPIRRLLRFGGETFEEFLHSLEDVHDRAKMTVPDLEVPRLRLAPAGENRFRLHYNFAKRGYGSIILGMLRGMADDYCALVVIEHFPERKAGRDVDVFDIALVRLDSLAALEQDSMSVVTRAGSSVQLNVEMLDQLMPLHLQVDRFGIIRHLGPSFAKLVDGKTSLGTDVFDVLSFRRPIGIEDWSTLFAAQGAALTVRLNALPDCNLRAVCVPLADGDTILIDFSLGVGAYDIVSTKNLNRQDFSPADQTGEMLYLKEVQTIVLDNSISLSMRLDGAKKTAELQAFTDALTGLHNRRALYGFITRLQERKSPIEFAVLQIDLDFFKAVNDSHGHAAGDYVLKEVAHLLLGETRKSDMVARLGGDEFVVVLSDYGTEQQLLEIANRIIEKIAKPIIFEQQECRIGASIGAAIATDETGFTVDVLLEQADAALYQSKRLGRGMFHLWEDATEAYEIATV